MNKLISLPSYLLQVDNYPEFIKLVAEFTVKSLQTWHCGPNSVHYLLSLWQRMVASVPYVKATEPHLLERFIPQITTAYITSRLEAVPIIFRDGLEDPLDDPSALLQQLDQLSTIGKCGRCQTADDRNSSIKSNKG